MRPTLRSVAAATCVLSLAGCLAPWSIRMPRILNNSPEVERLEQQYHDPYPDSQMGPSTGSRPLRYQDQRPLPVRIREKSDGTRSRGFGGVTAPPVSPSPGSQYPGVVPF